MQKIYERTTGDILFSTDKSRLDTAMIHRFLTRSYWAAEIPMKVVERSIENSCCIGVYNDGIQIGFGRVITDYATFAYLADVFIEEKFRGRGISKALMQFVVDLDFMKGLRRVLLATRDAHALYKKFEFKSLQYPERFMELHRSDIYQKNL